MKKSVDNKFIILFVTSIILLVSVSFINTGFLNNSWNKITGNVIGELDVRLIAHYSFEGNANDVSGRGHHGTNNGATLTTGKIGQAYSFDGDDYIKIENLNSNVYAISFWINSNSPISSSSNENVILQYNTPKNIIAIGPITGFIKDESLIIIEGSDADETRYRTAIKDYFLAGWHFITFTWDSSSSRYKVYVDGVERTITSGTGNHVPLASFDDFSVGGGDNSNYNGFSGQIDEVKIWTRALNSTEIQEEYKRKEGCIEDWSCADWSDCMNEKQTRTCTDSNKCGTEGSKPIESQGCSTPELSESSDESAEDDKITSDKSSQNKTFIFWIAIIIVLIILYIIFKKKRS